MQFNAATYKGRARYTDANVRQTYCKRPARKTHRDSKQQHENEKTSRDKTRREARRDEFERARKLVNDRQVVFPPLAVRYHDFDRDFVGNDGILRTQQFRPYGANVI